MISSLHYEVGERRVQVHAVLAAIFVEIDAVLSAIDSALNGAEPLSNEPLFGLSEKTVMRLDTRCPLGETYLDKLVTRPITAVYIRPLR